MNKCYGCGRPIRWGRFCTVWCAPRLVVAMLPLLAVACDPGPACDRARDCPARYYCSRHECRLDPFYSDAGTPPADAATADASSASVFILDEALTWIEARDRCRALGADLVTISSQDEHDAAWELAGGAAWIGATDADSEGSWRWSSGAVWADLRWGPSQPDNAGSGEHCGALWFADGAWADVSCDSELRAVCEAR